MFNANNTPYISSVGPGQPQPADFSPTLGIETQLTNRALRLRRLLGQSKSISEADLYRIKYDLKYDESYDPIIEMRDFLALGKSNLEPTLHEAFDLLAAWDLSTDRNNPAAALGVLTLTALVDVREQRGSVDFSEELASAQNYLLENFSRIDPAYGDVVVHKRGTQEWPIDGGPDILRAVYTNLDEDTGRRYNVAGDSYIMFVEWDNEGVVSSRAIHNFGSATLDEASPHYADQAPLFVEMKDREVRLELDDVIKHASRDYRPGR